MANNGPYAKVNEEVKHAEYNENAPPYLPAGSPVITQAPQAAVAWPTAVTVTPGVNPNPPVGPQSTEVTCPQCRCRIKTAVRHRSTTKTHIACILLCPMCCCCLPYCIDSCRNANHFCPTCGAFIGTYSS